MMIPQKRLACHATSPHSQSHWAHPFPRTGRQSFLEQGVLFAAQCHGIDLTTSSLLIISFIILLNTFSTPSVPMAGIFSLNIIFQSVGLPLAAIDLMMGIYNILDMFVTLANVAGNGISTVLTIFLHKSRDESN